jgi:hypothetical protein
MRLTQIIYFLKNEASRITETRHSGNRANSLLRPNRTPYTTSNINFFFVNLPFNFVASSERRPRDIVFVEPCGNFFDYYIAKWPLS